MYLVKYVSTYDSTDRGRPYKIVTYTKESDAKTKANIYKTISKMFHVIDENEVTEVLHNILENDIGTKLSPIEDILRIHYEYNPAIGYLLIETHLDMDSPSITDPVTDRPLFQFDFGGIKVSNSNPFNNVGAIEFLKFLNQEITLKNYFKIQIPTRA